TPTCIKEYVESTLEYQRKLGPSILVSLTVLADDVNGPWSHIALGLAFASAEIASNEEPVSVSLCIDQEAIRNGEALDEFMNMLSTLDVNGLYITVKNDNGSNVEEGILEKMIYLCYILGDINKYEVIFGYSDLLGIPLFVTDIDGVGSGWFNGMNN